MGSEGEEGVKKLPECMVRLWGDRAGGVSGGRGIWLGTVKGGVTLELSGSTGGPAGPQKLSCGRRAGALGLGAVDTGRELSRAE